MISWLLMKPTDYDLQSFQQHDESIFKIQLRHWFGYKEEV